MGVGTLQGCLYLWLRFLLFAVAADGAVVTFVPRVVTVEVAVRFGGVLGGVF